MADYSKRPYTAKQLSAVEKAGRMIEWFKTAKLPSVPYVIDSGSKIMDMDLFVASQCGDLLHSEPLGQAFTNSYLRLYNLKQYIIKNEPTTDNGNP